MKKGKVRTRSARARQFNLLEGLEPRTLMAATKIMPLGDSITEQLAGHASYRWSLYNQLTTLGYEVDFVGSKTGINGGAPLYSNFDQNHEGYSGWRADQLQANAVNWVTQNRPDIVLLHIGTNDIEQGQSNTSTITEISGIIDNIRSVVPNVKVLLAQVIPFKNFNTQVLDLNSRIATLVGQKNTAQSPVILVDQYTGFSETADLYDNAHPDDSGERKIANKFLAALTPLLPAPTPPSPVTYVSNLTPTFTSNGWGPAENDMSNAESGAGDGRYLGLNTIGYLKGIGVHANSDIRYNLVGGNYTEFRTDIGVDDEVGNGGSVVFQVYLDNVLKYTSPAMTGASTTISIPAINVTGGSTLRLVVTDNGNGNTADHADWANARLFSGPVVPVPNAPTNLDATLGTNQVNLVWTDNAGDEAGFRVQRKTGVAGTWAQIGSDLGANVTAYIDSTVASNTTYYYRVLAFNNGGPSNFSNEDNVTVPVPPGTTYLSDLTPTSTSNGWGPYERDRSNGETGATDGNPITLNGVVYPKGLGFHASAQIVYALNGQYTQFLSDIGIDDEAGNNGSVIFQVFLDGAASPIYQSPTMTGASTTITIPTINVTGVQSLRLVITDGGNGNTWDHADWANARVIAGTAPLAPTGLGATVVGQQINLAWTDNASNETGYRVERKTGAAGTWAQLGSDLAANATTYSDTTATPGTQYYYRALALGSPLNSGYSNEANNTVPIQVPATPTGLGATAVSSQINLAWTDNASNETGYRVERKTGSGGTYAQLGSNLAVNANSYSDTTATPGVQYYYRVIALGAQANSTASNEANATIPIPAPNAPTNLDAVVSGQQINLTWTDNAANETGYRVQRKTGAGGTYAQIGSDLAANAVSYSDTTAVAGTEYYYRVLAFNTGGPSGFSNEDNATVPLPPAPSAPTGLGATLVGAQVNLAWTDTANNETGFRIDRKIGIGGTYTQLVELGANVTTYSDLTVQPGTTYYYRVYAYNLGGNSGYSNEPTISTPTTVYVSDLPYTVVANGWGLPEKDRSNGETGAADGTTIRLNGVAYTKGIGVHALADITVNLNSQYSQFLSDVGMDDEVGNNGSVVFQVYLDGVLSYDSGTMTGATATKQVNLNTLGKTTMRLLVTDAGNGNAYDHADWANARLILGTPVPVPAQPTGLGATLNGVNVDLAWTDAASDETSYKVQRKMGVGGTWGTIQTLGVNATSWTDTGPLNPNTTYYYRVFAVNGGGDSLASNEANITTAPIPVPAAPSGLGAIYNVGTSKIDLAWTDNSSDETGFRIERKLGVGGTWGTVTTVGQNVLTYSDSGPFLSNTSYYYRVIAVNAGGDSVTPSNEANATTPAAPVQTWLSDLNWTSATNGWGAVEKDRSNGEIGATDGKTITLNGVTYAKGLGTHSNSSIVYNLNGQYKTFQSDIGVDDESGSNGSVVFQVFVDELKVFDSGVMTGNSLTQAVNLNVTSATTLRLVVINANDNFDYDHGDWAGAKLVS